MLNTVHAATLSEQIILPRNFRSSLRGQLWQLLAALFLFVSLLSQLFVRVSIIHSGYELERVRSVALKNDVELRELHLQYATLSRPTELSEIAKKSLGMVETPRDRVRSMKYVQGSDSESELEWERK